MSAQILPFLPRRKPGPGSSSPPAAPAPCPFEGPCVAVPGGREYPLELALEMIHPENLLWLARVHAFPKPFPPAPPRGTGPRAA